MKDYIFIDQDINKLRNDIKGSKRFLFTRLDDQCRRYEGVNLPSTHPQCSTTYMGMAIANLSLAYVLTKQNHYKDEAIRWIKAVISYPHWGNAHLVDVDLSASWILFGLSIGYDWLKDDIDEALRTDIVVKLVLQGKRMYDFKIETEGSGWSTNYWQNHNWINLNGLATAGYALRSDYANANAWTECAKENFDIVYDVMAKDGSDYEGVVYWRYGAMWLFVYGHLLKERENINYFESSDFMKNTFYYKLYQAAPNLEEQINFGDAHDRKSGHSTCIYYKVASEYNNGHAQKLANLVSNKFLYREAYESGVKPGILPEIFFDLLFYNDEVEEKPFDTLPLNKYFEDLGLLVIRDSWDLDSLHFSFKCGSPGGKLQWEKLWELKETKNYNCFGLSHHHPDNNSFILHGNGKFLAIDDGYNRSVKASDHNVCLVDGMGFEDENQNNVYKNYTKDMIGVIEDVEINDNYVWIVGETARTYNKDATLKRFARHVLYTHHGYFVLLDELASDRKREFTFLYHGDAFPTIEKDYLKYELGLSCMRLYDLTSTATSMTFKENKVRAVMTTQEPDNYRETKMKTVHQQNIELSNEMSFMHLILPYKLGEEVMIQVNKITLDNGYGVEIVGEDFKDVFLVTQDDCIDYEGKTYEGHKILIQYDQNLKETVVRL